MEISTLRTLIDKEIDRIPGIRKDYKKSIVILKKEISLLLDLFESEKKKDIKPLAPPTSLPINLNPPIFEEPDKVPYGTICPCNPANGGSGICGCTLGNTMVANPKKYGYPKTNWNPYPNLGESDCTNSANTNGSWSINPENLVNHKIGNETGTF